MSDEINIVLCCSAGMSTSLVVENMKKAADEKGINAKIKAVPVSSLEEINGKEHIDAIMLGPQVRFKLNELKNIYKEQNTFVDVINMADYGMINGEKILNDIIASCKN
ncbi:PTS sugar transporter subunit IIB [Anaerococcus tetradius]|uniref:PTS system, Lactose/Cellobiose specific IIB subunit n=1 Tax=Anaerococcus tetradius ATCC 35098 TaxID=525255 RepID=C2CHT2_9FIRM|nr:PTS sugar transporter subunit IIB [Anaerococcus tetradius]EEI82857.1 PTS system, Lactose/Cellobiose specific IIB subunit [Anaerococcus tetradius ATCC 35098]